MSGVSSGSIQLSQGYEVLVPKTGKAYMVPCEEWNFLIDALEAVSAPPWVLPAISFLLIGASLTTLISIFLGGVAPGPSNHGIVVACAIFVTTGLSGGAFLFVSFHEHELQDTRVRDVVKQMELIEKRFEQGTAPKVGDPDPALSQWAEVLRRMSGRLSPEGPSKKSKPSETESTDGSGPEQPK